MKGAGANQDLRFTGSNPSWGYLNQVPTAMYLKDISRKNHEPQEVKTQIGINTALVIGADKPWLTIWLVIFGDLESRL